MRNKEARKYHGRRRAVMPPESDNYGRIRGFSYHQRSRIQLEHSDHSSTASKSNDGGHRLKKIIVYVVLLILLVLELIASSRPIIRAGSGSSNLTPSQMSSYQSASEQIISSTLADRTKLTFNKDGLITKLKSKFPEIREVRISFSLTSSQPTISLSLYQPALVLEATGGKLLIDSSGGVISQAGVNRSVSKLPILIDDSVADSANIRGQLLPAGYVDFIIGLVNQLKVNGVIVNQFTLLPASTEIDASISGASYIAKFNLMGGYKEQAGSYVAASHYLAKKAIVPSKYIDLRLAGRAYYL